MTTVKPSLAKTAVVDNFSIGSTVTWTSQSGGFTKTKSGVVEEIVPPRSYPSRDRCLQLYTGSGVGLSRDHVSYVVRVPGKTAKAAGKLYWPRVACLKKGEPCQQLNSI